MASVLRLLLAAAVGAVLGVQACLHWAILAPNAVDVRDARPALRSPPPAPPLPETAAKESSADAAEAEALCDARPPFRARALGSFCARHDHPLPPVEAHERAVTAAAAAVSNSDADAKAVRYLYLQWRKCAAEVKRLRLLADVKPGDPTHNLLYPFPIVSSSSAATACGKEAEIFSVSTLNLWNLNEWSARRPAIARVLEALQLDVVALQEVRLQGKESSGVSSSSQAHQLLSDIQGLAHVAHEIVDAQLQEGLAILSRHRIVSHELHLLTDNDHNNKKSHEPVRGVLHAEISIDDGSASSPHLTVHVFNVHLGIEDLPQCAHVRRLLDIVRSKVGHGGPVVLLGDFNAYFDFEWPVDLLTGRLPSDSNALAKLLRPCSDELMKTTSSSDAVAHDTDAQLVVLTDAFEVMYPPEKIPLKGNLDQEERALFNHGYTYGTQTMGHDWSRPDRIMWTAASEQPLFGAPCEAGNFGVGVLEAEDARFKRAPGVGLSDHLGVVARWPVLRAQE